MRRAAILIAIFLLAGTAGAHYHFLHYTTTTGPFTPVPEKFDLNALPNGTLHYFISGQGPEVLAPGDSFTAIVSQLRLAARAWSEVGASQLRLEFGGFSAPDTLQSTPGVDVLFGELPPGLLAMGGPTTRAGAVLTEAESFVPITRSVLILQRDLSQRPSYGDAFFLTAVHELGHALGLQHTIASSVMSTQVTRATTRSKPLAQDDIAGLSALYPTPEFAVRTGSVAGRVTLDGTGVHLASVAALGPSGTVVTVLTDPDGYYRLVGIPSGQYYLYVQPLPPAYQSELGPADIVLPAGPEDFRFQAGPVFQTQFYPGTGRIADAQALSIVEGKMLDGVDFAVQARGPLDLFGVTTYSFPGNYAVKPAFVNTNGNRRFLVASGAGLIEDNALAPGLQVDVLGGSASVPEGGAKAYAPAPAYLQVDFQFTPFSGEGPRHLLFSRNNDTYVLPAGLTLVRRQPPSIAAVTPFVGESGQALALVAGNGLSKSTAVFFDGLPAAVLGVDEENQSLAVAPPTGAAGHRAIVTASNPDGQGSLFLDAAAPQSYAYDPAAPEAAAVAPGTLPAGSEAMIEVTGVGTHFAQGQTVVGFGTSDVVVRRVWVLGPAHVLANVHVAAAAPVMAATMTVVTGFETLVVPSALQLEAPDPAAMAADPRVLNAVTNLPSVYAGGQAAVFVSNLPENPTVEVTLNDLPAAVLETGEDRVVFSVPAQLSAGPAILRITVGGQKLQPVIVSIDPPPPSVLRVLAAPEVAADANHPAEAGQLLVVVVAGLAEPGISGAPERLRVTVGGVDHVPAKVYVSDSDHDVHILEFNLSPVVPAGTSVPLTVRIADRLSTPFPIAVAGPPLQQ